ncbi:hypothetical protein RN001_006264 [Aquatica leii]|uniref:Methyltransferase domain-containing protein n=1 Tax=Aquatica leii TaxID=1421715 RepID=A0AAN7SS79_9COLE|nr:hypothetical protein RN001_006264 [Aquatica leii]
MLPTQNLIKTHIETIISWIEPLLPVANSHMVEYFSKSVFKNSLPEDLYNEITNIGFDNTLEFIFNSKKDLDAPNLSSYIGGAKNLHLCNLKEVCFSKTNLNKKLIEWGSGDISSLKLEVFVTPKKSHEIEILSKITTAISLIKKTTHIIDVGGGKGYLGSLLALHHKIPVLSIDASLTNAHGAIKRLRLLERAWNSLKQNPKQSVPINKNQIANCTGLYKQITEFVTEDTNFDQLIENAFLEKSCNFGLIGLHTCGDLGSTCLKIFNKNYHIKFLCNVACCYHLLSEECEDSRSDLNNVGFPLSAFLKNKGFKLGRTVRMLAAQSIDRILHKKELPNKTVLYRAILEVLLDKYDVDYNSRKVGKIKKECNSFLEYASFSLSSINAKIQFSVNEIEDLFNTYKVYEQQLYVFYMLRCMLAPVVESLILLDRLLFLHENGHQTAFLVHLFDAIVSPRCYGIIAFKDV